MTESRCLRALSVAVLAFALASCAAPDPKQACIDREIYRGMKQHQVDIERVRVDAAQLAQNIASVDAENEKIKDEITSEKGKASLIAMNTQQRGEEIQRLQAQIDALDKANETESAQLKKTKADLKAEKELKSKIDSRIKLKKTLEEKKIVLLKLQ